MNPHGTWIRPELFAAPQPPSADEAVALAVASCPGCGRVEFPVRARCVVCSGRTDTVALRAEGVVQGFTTVHHTPPGSQVEAPYTIGIVAFDEGVAILGVLDTGGLDPERGARAVTVAAPVGDAMGYRFRLVGAP